MGTSTRRGMLASLGTLLSAGAVGAIVTRESGETASTTNTGPTRTLRSTDLRFARPGTAAGELPAPGTPSLPYATLLEVDGSPAGLLSSSLVAGSAGSDLLHRLELADGTILAVGPSGVDQAEFTILSGTGRYTGATGTYTARQAPRAGLLTLDLTLPEA